MLVRFDRFVFDSSARELRDGQGPVHLSPKAFQLLETLLAAWPRALAKAELKDRLWPDTYVVEANLANLVAEIRAVLGDDQGHPRFIRTVRGFGYAFREALVGRVMSEAPQARPGPSTRADEGRSAHWVVWGRQVIPLHPGENVLGRDEGATVRITSPGVSRRHARISILESGTMLEDLGSKNGTYLHDDPIDGPTALAPGDTFRLGLQTLVFGASERDVPTLTEPGERSERSERRERRG